MYLGRKKFLEVSRCSRAKQRQRNVQKGVLYVQNFWLIRPIWIYFAVLFEKLQILTRASLLTPAKCSIEYRKDTWWTVKSVRRTQILLPKAVTQTCQAAHAHTLTTCPFCNFGKSVLKIFISSGLQTSPMRTADITSEKITKTRKILAQKLHSRLPLLNQDRHLIEGTRKIHLL